MGFFSKFAGDVIPIDTSRVNGTVGLPDGVSVLMAALDYYDAQDKQSAAWPSGGNAELTVAKVIEASKRLMKITGMVEGCGDPRGLTKSGLKIFWAAMRWGQLNRIMSSGSDSSLLLELGWANAALREAISEAGLRYPKSVAANHVKAVAPCVTS